MVLLSLSASHPVIRTEWLYGYIIVQDFLNCNRSNSYLGANKTDTSQIVN